MRATVRRVSSSTMRSISGCPPGRPSALARWFASRASRAQRLRSSVAAGMVGSCALGRRSRRLCAALARCSTLPLAMDALRHRPRPLVWPAAHIGGAGRCGQRREPRGHAPAGRERRCAARARLCEGHQPPLLDAAFQVSTRSAASGALSSTRSRGARRPGRAALPLFPVAERLVRHVDAARQLGLGKPQPPPDPARESRHVLHGLFLVLPLLQGDVRLGGGVYPGGIEPPFGQGGPIVGINPDARCAHSPQPPSGWPCGWRMMRTAEPRTV